MANQVVQPRQVIRRPAVVAKPVEVEPEPEPEEIEQEEESQEEEVEPEPAPTRKVTIVRQGVKPVVVPPAVVKSAPSVTKPTPKVAEIENYSADSDNEVKPSGIVRIQKVDELQMSNLLTGIMTSLDEGQAIVITALEIGKYSIGPANAKQAALSTGKLSGNAYWDEVLDPKYVEWQNGWLKLTISEKHAMCKKNNVTWEHHDIPAVDVIRMTQAYTQAMGIEKYKEKYREQSARKAIKA